MYKRVKLVCKRKKKEENCDYTQATFNVTDEPFL